MASRFASKDAAIRQGRSWVVRVAFLVGTSVCMATLLAGALYGAGISTLLMCAFGAAVTLVSALRKDPPESEGRVEAGEAGLYFEGKLMVAAASVKSARLIARGDAHPLVRIKQRRLLPDFDVRVSNLEDGRSLVEAIDPASARRAPAVMVRPAALGLRDASFRAILAGAATFVSMFIVGLLAMSFNWQPFALAYFPVWAAAMAGFAVLPFVRTRIEIGHDGLLCSWLGASRFIPYIDIRVVYAMVNDPMVSRSPGVNPHEGVHIFLTSGESLKLWSDESEVMYHLIAQAVDGWWRRDGSVQSAVVQRGPRDPEGWLRVLQSVGARASTGYRNASMTDELWRIVEDVAAAPDARAGAAVALGRSLGDEGRERLQKAARVTAQPKLRIAIETAAQEADEAALVAALAEVEAPAAVAKASRLDAR